MANPQKENGYTPIANEIMEALARFPFNGSQLRLIIFLLRKTYGWNKKEDQIAISQWVLGTGLSRRQVLRELKNLREMNVIVQNKKCLRKDFSGWDKVTGSSLLPTENIGDKLDMVTSSSLKGDKSVTPQVTDRPLTKDTITKDTNTKDKEIYILAFEKIWERYPNKDGRKAAERHFSATVKTPEQINQINKALDNYLQHLQKEDWKRPKNGSTWFNNWQDWIKNPLEKGGTNATTCKTYSQNADELGREDR